MRKQIDLNCDLGEGFGIYTLGEDEKIADFITSANIACGFHAGDPGVIKKTIDITGPRGINIGAHPSLPDLIGFGRRNMAVTPQEVINYLIYQIGAVKTFAEVAGFSLKHVKPHGSLYNMASTDKKLATAIVESIALIDPDLIIIAPAVSAMAEAAKEKGLSLKGEFFADRNYNEDGTLLSRRDPQAIIKDPQEVCARTLEVINSGFVKTTTGKLIPLEVETICVHGDTPKAVEFARLIKESLLENNIEVKAF